MRVDTDFFDNGQDYEARGIVARIQRIGEYEQGPLLRLPIYRYLTLDCGKGRPSVVVKFVGQAKFIENEEGRFLDITDMKEGQIIVAPGFVYKKVQWSDALMAEHMKALQTYKPKDIIKASKDEVDAPIDIGEIDLTGATKQ